MSVFSPDGDTDTQGGTLGSREPITLLPRTRIYINRFGREFNSPHLHYRVKTAHTHYRACVPSLLCSGLEDTVLELKKYLKGKV